MKPILVTAGIIVKAGKILIARRSGKKHLAGFWEFPGGKIEDGEAPEECLLREIKEELGIEIEVKRLFHENTHEYSPDKIILLKSFICSHVSGEIRLKDHDEFNWVRINDFDSYKIAPADLPIIERFKLDLDMEPKDD